MSEDLVTQARRLAGYEVHDGDFTLKLCAWAAAGGLEAIVAPLSPWPEDDPVIPPPGPAYGVGSPEWNGTAKLIEECGELLQMLGKIMATGTTTHWEGDLRRLLIEELGDTQAALGFFITHNLTPAEEDKVFDRARAKADLFDRWSEDQAS